MQNISLPPKPFILLVTACIYFVEGHSPLLLTSSYSFELLTDMPHQLFSLLLFCIVSVHSSTFPEFDKYLPGIYFP